LHYKGLFITGDVRKSEAGHQRQTIITPWEEEIKIRLLGALVGLALSFALPTIARYAAERDLEQQVGP